MDFNNIILLVGMLLYSCVSTINGQTIKRHVISSLGTNHVQYGGGCTAITVGQPPNAGTLSNGSNFLRQGFQQPSGDCPIQISFDVSESIVPDCGTYYVFEYTGNIDPNTSVSWNFGGDASPSIVNDVVTPEISFREEGTIIFTITVSDGTCMRTRTSTVFVAEAPFSVSSDIVNAWCAGDRGDISLVTNGGAAPYDYMWNTSATSPTLSDLLPGIYRFTVTDNNGCAFEQSAEVLGSTDPFLISGDVSSEICEGSEDGTIDITVLNGEAPYTFTWDDGALEANREGLVSGTYNVMIQDANGCTIDTSFFVKRFCDLEPEEVVPGIFTPNGDGFNDDWVIEDIHLFPNNNVRIYNRWGNLVWDIDGFTTWDGRNNAGELLQSAAYYYVIMLNDADDTTLTGSVTLVR